MASEVDICNLALGHLGDSGTVASLYPPEGSAQAEHCARFYPMARDEVLSAHPWGFATKRVQLTQLSAPSPGWDFAYAYPQGVLDVMAVCSPDQPDPGIGVMPSVTEPYVTEATADGARVIYCNVRNAVMHGIFRVTSTERFPPLFVTAVVWQLASKLAGPIIKGSDGAAESKRCAQMAQAYLSQAKVQDSNQRSVKPVYTPDWIAARGTSIGNTWGR